MVPELAAKASLQGDYPARLIEGPLGVITTSYQRVEGSLAGAPPPTIGGQTAAMGQIRSPVTSCRERRHQTSQEWVRSSRLGLATRM
jgi:hypothetical protein